MATTTKTAGPKILTVEELLAADDRPEKTLDVPEWGGAVKIRALSLGQFQEIQRKATVGGEVDEATIAMLTLVEGVVEPPLTAEHAPLLAEKSVQALTRVMEAIAELSATRESDLVAAEARFPAAPE